MLPPFSVVIPCFNEAARIGETLRLTLDYLATNALESELIVVNDGSTDETGTNARGVLRQPKIKARLLENFPNRGKGAAVCKGLLAAQKPIGLFFDADLSTPLEEIPKVIEPVAKGDVDIAFGSRALNRGVANMPVAFSTCSCASRLACRFGTPNAVLKRSASMFAARSSRPRTSMASPLMWSCSISPGALDYASAKFLCAGTTPKAARYAFSTTACECCAKLSRYVQRALIPSECEGSLVGTSNYTKIRMM